MFERIIKIPGKTAFTELTLYEVALMIEADSSLSEEGNSYFASCALDEFLHFSNLEGREDLKEVQSQLLESIYIDVEGQVAKDVNAKFLEDFARKLKIKLASAI